LSQLDQRRDPDLQVLALRLARRFEEVNMDQSLLSGLLEVIMDLDGVLV